MTGNQKRKRLEELCRELINARDKGNMTDFWAAIGKIAGVVKTKTEEELNGNPTPNYV